MIKIILVVVAVVVLVFVVLVLLHPSEYRVARSAAIAAPP